MTMIDAAVEAIKAAGWDGLARDFKTRPEYRERIAKAMERNVTREVSPELGRKMGELLRAAARGR